MTLLRQIEVKTASGKTTPLACKEAEITVQTFYGGKSSAVEAGPSKATQGVGEGEKQAASGGPVDLSL